MGKFIRLKKGFDINLAGKATAKIAEVEQAETFVIKPTDFHGLYMPKPVVKEGDNVKAGSPLFHDKRHENVMYVSPVSGEVVEIKRGEKRKLLEIKILADRKNEYEPFRKYSVSEIANLPAQDTKDLIAKSGAWPNLVQRPYGIVADPNATPKAIHISAFDTSPLAPDCAAPQLAEQAARGEGAAGGRRATPAPRAGRARVRVHLHAVDRERRGAVRGGGRALPPQQACRAGAGAARRAAGGAAR